MQNISHSPLVAAAVVSILAPTFAARADETVLQEIVVTAAMNRGVLDVAQPAAVLGGDDLARQRTSSLGDTLARQLGVSSTYFGPAASRPVIRGLGGYRVQTLLDGVSTLDIGSLSDDHAVTADPALADQLEVLKGPATLLYGSGAAGGLVNVVTPRMPKLGDGGLNGFAEARAGSAADERAGVASLTFAGENDALHVDAFKSKSDAIDIPGETLSRRMQQRLAAAGDAIDAHSGTIPNAFSDAQGGAIGGAIGRDALTLGGNVSRYENTYGIPSEESAFIEMRQTRYQAQADWTANEGWLRSVQIAGALNDYEHVEFEAANEPGTRFTQDAYELRIAANHMHSDAWRGTVGAQWTHIDFMAAGDEAFVPASLTRSLGVFALEEVDVAQWTFSLGARLETQKIDVDPPLPHFNDSAASGAAGAIWKINERDTLAVSLTHSARHPQATELYANGPHLAAQRFELGAAELATEKANTIDVTLRRTSDTISWLFGVFYNDYSNFVFAAPTGNLNEGLVEVQYAQSPAKLYGYEAELWLPLAKTSQGVWRLRVMSDYTRGEQVRMPLPQMPPLRAGLGVHFDRGKWHAEVEGIYHATQDRVAINELPTDSYVMANADVSYRFAAEHGEWFVFLRATNLLDEDARQHTSALKDFVPLPGRALNAGVRISF